ncbi:CDC48 family AAA ATPase [Candidatus Woesearchaeota archaeon]|nr:CDC48 family AAA ATPase [Candidatus Woesearchaeota archaeon]
MVEVNLKVAEAIQDDVNKGIVRVDSKIMHQVGVRSGDIVQIEGERKTVGIVDRAYPGDIGLNIIRMDGILRRNSKTGIGEIVKVNKAEVKPAKKVVVAPARRGIMIRAPPELFQQGLLGRAVMKGDIVSLGGTRRRRTTMSDNPFADDIFSILDESMMGFGLGDIKFVVADTNPKDAVLISNTTEVVFNPEAAELKEEEKAPEVSYEDIGGLRDEIKKIREMVELPLKHPEIFERLGIDPPKGVLLHGPPGTGKTLLAKAVANETNSNFILINGPEIMSKYYGQSEENLRKKFDDAEKNSPSIIFIDEIDAIATKREETKGEVERRVVAQMLALMDGLQSRGKVVVIAASNVPNLLEPALRRPGRFDREVEIGVPDKDGRLDVLKIHTRNMPLDTTLSNANVTTPRKEIITSVSQNLHKINIRTIAAIIEESKRQTAISKETVINEIVKVMQTSFSEVKLPQELKNSLANLLALDFYVTGVNDKEINDALSNRMRELESETNISNMLDATIKEKILQDIAMITHGFVGADLQSLAKEAAIIVLRRILPELQLEKEEAIPHETLEKLKITQKDFLEALKVVRPSAMREVLVEVPTIKWEDIGGLKPVKQELMEAVEWPLKNPEVFTRMGVTPPKGILLYGPPGTGKTMLAKAVANESEANFILIKGPELLSKWVGESEKAVRKIFEKARQTSPSIIFFDEIDSLAPRRGASGDNRVTERVVNQLLTEIDGLEELHNVVVIGATNRPDILDTALLRPGRFDRIILVGVPDMETRAKIFQIHTKAMPLAKDVALSELAQKTEGYAGADIASLCREAAIIALRKDMNSTEVKKKDFEDALATVRASITKEIEDTYKALKDQFTKARAKEMKDSKPSYFM